MSAAHLFQLRRCSFPCPIPYADAPCAYAAPGVCRVYARWTHPLGPPGGGFLQAHGVHGGGGGPIAAVLFVPEGHLVQRLLPQRVKPRLHARLRGGGG
eukprot:279443-Prorocentrum_minimum.AAC.1